MVLLGGARTGTRLVSRILGLQDQDQDHDSPVDQHCSKYHGEVAGRRVVLVSTPAWFSSSCPPEQRNRLISSFITLSSPGPHAFLLCVPVERRPDGEVVALDVLQELLGPAIIASNTLVLFTHLDVLEDEPLEEYLFTWRKDLLQLLERCGDRYHTLEVEDEARAVEELLDKMERVERLSCPLYQEVERRLRERQVEVARRTRGEDHNLTEEDLEAAREEAESTVGDLDVSVDHLFPSASLPPPSSTPCFLWNWVQWLSRLVRREALLGALVGLLVGGPYGGVVGASVGCIATEVQRRKTQKTK